MNIDHSVCGESRRFDKLNCGDSFVYENELYIKSRILLTSITEYRAVRLWDGEEIYMVVTPPAFLHERLNCEPQILDELVYYCELFCGWVYFCTKPEAENIMVYKLKPANGSLMFEPVNT